MNALLAALASIPRIASALEGLATAFSEINRRATKAQAASRRKTKDDEVDERIAALVGITTCRMPDGEAGELGEVDGAPRVSGGSDACACIHCGCAQNNKPT
jgi:hypothetical protein